MHAQTGRQAARLQFVITVAAVKVGNPAAELQLNVDAQEYVVWSCSTSERVLGGLWLG